MKVAIYARVSTANNGQDSSMQTRELREYAERRGWAVGDVDVGISGTKETRLKLDRLNGRRAPSPLRRRRGLDRGSSSNPIQKIKRRGAVSTHRLTAAFCEFPNQIGLAASYRTVDRTRTLHLLE